MKRFSFRYWISKSLTALVVGICVLPFVAITGLYHSNSLRNAQISSAIANIMQANQSLERADIHSVKISEGQKLPLESIVSDLLHPDGILNGKLFLTKVDQNLYILWGTETEDVFLNGEEAAKVDKKMDDGLPFTGRLTVNPSATCIINHADGIVIYDKAVKQPCVYFYFKISHALNGRINGSPH